MNPPGRRAEFFVLEATEYLSELEQLVGRTETPDLERLVRGARALRGAALMAGLGTFARAAASLEGLARQVRDHALGWDPHARGTWREGLQSLRGLVSRAAGWESADDRHALLLAERIERVTRGEASAENGAAAPSFPDSGGQGLTPGVRAFIARESALIAGSLQEAARALAPLQPPVALAGVLERLRSLRGLGGSAELSPLPELLDAMEVTTRSLLSPEPAPPDIAAVFADAADALASMAQSVADQGRVIVPSGLDQVARRLLEGYAALTDVTEIGALAPAGEQSVVARGSAPIVPSSLEPVPVELVGVGDHLLMQSEALARGRSPAARDLRLYVLHQTLSTMPAESRTGRFLRPLTGAIARTIGSGRAHADPDGFGAMLRDCGQFLVDHGGDGTVTDLITRRDAMARALGAADLIPTQATTPESEPVVPEAPLAHTAEPRHLGDTPPPTRDASPVPVQHGEAGSATGVAGAAGEDEVVPIAALAPESDAAMSGEEIVPIDSLAPDVASAEIATDIVSIDTLAPDDSDILPIEALAPDDVDVDVVSIESLAYEVQPAAVDRGAVTPGTPGRLERAYRRLRELEQGAAVDGDEEAICDIATLLYRGERALSRTSEIHAELSALLSVTSIDLPGLRPLLDELVDLVPLARDAA